MPRTLEANMKIRQERKERIRMGALELFVANGLAGTRISDIAGKVRMSNGLVYHYFSSKEEIFIDLIQTAFERMTAACDLLAADPAPPHEKIRTAMTELVRTIRTRPSACRYFVLITRTAISDNIPARAREIAAKNRDKPHEVITSLIEQGQRTGQIRQGKPKDLAFFFWNTVNGLAIHQAMYGSSARKPDLEPVFHMFFKEEHT